jgi:hypothetical protein
MQTLTDRYVIAVTGIQGVGKTTLLKKLYNIEDDVLLTNQGRGEQIPILFTEKKTEERKAYMYRIYRRNHSLVIEKDQIGRTEVNSLSSNYNPTTDLFIELEVPEAVFDCDNKHFLLLPGIESKNSYMYNLTWSALRTAANCVIVMFSNAYAKVDNRNLIDKLNSDFKNSNPVFVLSMADQITDQNESFRKTVIHDLKITDNDRVIITGTSVELMEQWPYKFKKTLQKYSASTSESIGVKRDNMDELLENLRDVRIELKNFLDKYDVTNQFAELKVDKYLSPFKTEFQMIRNDICEEFTKHMNDFENRMNKSVQNRIRETSFIQEILDGLFKRDITKLNEFQDMISSCLSEAIDCRFIESGFMKAIEQSQMKYLYANQKAMVDDSLDEMSRALLFTKNDQSISLTNNDLVLDIQHLYHPEKSVEVPRVGDSFELSLKTIPHIFNELLRINYLIPGVFKNNVDDRFLFIPASPESTQHALEIYSENKPTLSNALGAIIGLDMAMDGQLDLFNSMEKFIPQTAGKLAESVTAFIGVSMIVFHAYDYLSNLVNRTQIRKLETASAIVADMRIHIENEFINKYDKAVRVFSEYTVDMARQRLGLSKRLSVFWNLDQALNNLKEVSKSIK